tara:strand:- start:128 stop:586 length:459 start_codon:yes stop_codon:yes gene_type:complete
MSRVVVNEIEAKVGNDITFNDTVKIDTIKGKTTAGSVTVQGENTNTTNLQQGLNKVWFTLGVDAVQDDSFNCSSVDDDGTGDYGIHFTNDFNNALYSAGIAMTVTGLNPRGMVQSPDKAAGAVEVRIMSMNDGSATEGNITHCEMQICGDLA